MDIRIPKHGHLGRNKKPKVSNAYERPEDRFFQTYFKIHLLCSRTLFNTLTYDACQILWNHQPQHELAQVEHTVALIVIPTRSSLVQLSNLQVRTK